MINSGHMKQFKPYSNDSVEVNINNGSKCRIGISVGQDDFMSWKASQNPNTGIWSGEDIVFILNGEQIHLGRTYMYQAQEQKVNTKLIFPYGAPPSTKIQVVYYDNENLI